MGASLMTQLTDFAPPTIAAQGARLQSRQRFFNLVVTNVPGPQFPLFLMGRRMERVFPMVPLAKRQALCVGIMSYDGQVNFGLIGDYDAHGRARGLRPGPRRLPGGADRGRRRAARLPAQVRAGPSASRPRRGSTATATRARSEPDGDAEPES